MKTEDLITALQPLAGWHIYVVSDKRNDTVPCHTVRELEEHERRDRRNVVLTSSEGLDFPFPPGVTLLAKNIVRVDWADDRAWIEAKDHQLGYFQRVKPIETIESSKGAQDAK